MSDESCKTIRKLELCSKKQTREKRILKLNAKFAKLNDYEPRQRYATSDKHPINNE